MIICERCVIDHFARAWGEVVGGGGKPDDAGGSGGVGLSDGDVGYGEGGGGEGKRIDVLGLCRPRIRYRVRANDPAQAICTTLVSRIMHEVV